MMMKLLVFILALSASPALALPTTWQLEALLPLEGVLSGTVAYDTESSPIALNVRGLSNNASYQLTDFSLTVTPSAALTQYIPDAFTLSPTTTTYEFCVNHCVFGSGNVESFLFNNGQYALRLAFDPISGVMLANASEIKPITPAPFGLISMLSGSIQPVNVPEPATWMLLALGVVGLLSWRGVIRRGSMS